MDYVDIITTSIHLQLTWHLNDKSALSFFSRLRNMYTVFPWALRHTGTLEVLDMPRGLEFVLFDPENRSLTSSTCSPVL
jgi:hypothetical protein